MATSLTLIKNSYRKAGIVANGASISSLQSQVGLALLNETLSDLVTKGTLGRFKDVYTTSNCVANEFQRVFRNPSSVTVSLPITVVDHDTHDTRSPHDGAVIISAAPDVPQTVSIYSIASGSWQSIKLTALTQEVPLVDFQSDLEALLAVKLADERGIPVGPVLAREASFARHNLARRGTTASSVAKGDYM